jgi:hypothetical protein
MKACAQGASLMVGSSAGGLHDYRWGEKVVAMAGKNPTQTSIMGVFKQCARKIFTSGNGPKRSFL